MAEVGIRVKDIDLEAKLADAERRVSEALVNLTSLEGVVRQAIPLLPMVIGVIRPWRPPYTR